MTSLKSKIRLTIGAKLIGLIAILLLSSVVSLVWISTKLFSEDNTALIQQMNLDTASDTANTVREVFDGLNERSKVLGTLLLEEMKNHSSEKKVTDAFYGKDKDLLALYIVRRRDGEKFGIIKRAISDSLKSFSDEEGEILFKAILDGYRSGLSQVFNGEPLISTLSLPDALPGMFFALPFVQSGNTFSNIIVGVVRQGKFLKSIGEGGLITSFLVDAQGRVLIHPDQTKNKIGENLSTLPIVKQMLDGKSNNGQTRYFNPSTNAWHLGAFKLVGFSGLGVISEVFEAKAFEAADRVRYRSLLVAAIILSFSFFLGYLYSGTITWPIRELVHVSHRISQGDFNIHLKPKSQDEVAQLSLAFNEMAKGLEERAKVKATFSKFHSKEIAEKLMSGEVKLGGERKVATIFFSDVRGFTSMSESMQPEQVVEMLNEYMTRMVEIIQRNKGIVDKYVGDAIMALWGIPLTGDDDTYNALKACIEMRVELQKLNELRISRGQNALRIGMGLNRGQVIAGNIGSEAKMEYTVIGDAVNTASRMESMTKEYGTDLLIPKTIYDVLKGKFIFEQAESAKVKGKAEAIEVFKVKGYIDSSGKEILVETEYSTYGKEKSDKSAH
ncbi:MAG: HAMP domain-containing protein [Xanthomonadaceae bacterium]|nr:HAMP domain-containing protein [Xanthomonadaceae bacterium]